MDARSRDEAEQSYHEGPDLRRNQSGLLTHVYRSDVFEEAEDELKLMLGDIVAFDVLDYGCGTGDLTAMLCSKGAHTVALDISHARLLDAEKRLAALPGLELARFVQGSAHALPFEDASFDVVIGKGIIHHLDLEVAMGEIARVLRPGGRAFFLEPLIHNPLIQGYRLLTPHLRSETERALTTDDLQAMAGYFSSSSHTEYILLSLLPVLWSYVVGKRDEHPRTSSMLRSWDRALRERIPWLGRFYWEVIIELVK